MEKDNLESQLKQLINNTDQNLPTKNDGRERVWASINKTNDNKRTVYYISAAAVAIICLTSILWFNNELEPEKVNTKTEVKSNVNPVKPLVIENMQKDRQDKMITKSNPEPAPQLIAKKMISVDTFNREDEKVQVTVDYSKETKLTTISSLPKVEIAAANPKASDSEFTVEFKRGKPTETITEVQKRTLALKLKFGRDTSVFTSSNVIQPRPLKIKF
jgi:hypothetical protein